MHILPKLRWRLPLCKDQTIGLQIDAFVSKVAPMSPANTEETVRRFIATITRQERMLVLLKRELYDGQWNEMETDLRARLEGKPYIFKLADRIDRDLERIVRLREFEKQHGMDLADYIDLESQE